MNKLDEKATQITQDPQPSDLEVMRVTKNVYSCFDEPMTMERRRNIYRIIKESGILDREPKN